jgi:hypothetical protein
MVRTMRKKIVPVVCFAVVTLLSLQQIAWTLGHSSDEVVRSDESLSYQTPPTAPVKSPSSSVAAKKNDFYSKSATATATTTTLDSKSATTSIIQLDQKHSANPTTSKNTTIPTSTAIAMISMGDAPKSRNVQRCILSIRRRGLFEGPIIVVTDLTGEKHENYQRQILQWDKNTLVLEAKPEHLQASNTPKRRNHMGFKRFKTVVWDYVEEASIHRVLYVDIDVVVGKPLKDFFDYYEESVAQNFQDAPTTASFVSYFVNQEHKRQEPGKYIAHTGLMVLDRRHSPICLSAWQRVFDNKPKVPWDQVLLARAIEKQAKMATEDPSVGTCSIHELDMDQHVLFPEESDLQATKLKTFIHITRLRAGRIDNKVQEDYLTSVLKLDEKERKEAADMVKTFG